ncbi:MAG: hypothetical protein WC702_04610 [Patescibacteria group bacterium]|jgi:hypothetical protein
MDPFSLRRQRRRETISVGNITFLNQEAFDFYLFDSIESVAMSRNDDGTLTFFVVAFGVEMSADWIAGLQFVVSRDGWIERHEVSQFKQARYGCAVRIRTHLLSGSEEEDFPELDDGRHAVLATSAAACVVDLL